MSELFSWPTVTVGMRDPFVNGDPPAPGRGPGAGRFRLQVGADTTVALGGGASYPYRPWPVPWSAAPPRPRRCGGGRRQGSGFLTSVASVHPSTGRTPAGHRYLRAPGTTRGPGDGPGSARVRVTSAERDRGGQDT